MSTEQTPVEVTDDLDAFSAELFGQSKAPEPASLEEDADDVTEIDAQDDTQSETDALDDIGSDEEVQDEKPEPKKKNTVQERINEVVGKQRAAERRAQELEQKLTEALERLEKNAPKPDTPASKADVTDTSPQPTDMNADGTEKYPLGEFDPLYIKDLMRHALQEEGVKREELEKQRKEQAAQDEAQATLQRAWNEKLVPAKERYPDFQEVGEQMLGTFEGIDPAYGDYLTTTIMEMDYGPDVFYYLASNLDEAQKIVESGPKKATIALGRLEAKFAAAKEETPNRPKVSNAPPPPAHTNKGAAVAMPDVPDDTEDLDAFAKKLFKKK